MSDLVLSFVYPCYNRAALFKITLETFARQRFPTAAYEILVIDDGSTDNLLSLCRTFKEAHGLPIRYARIDVARVPYSVFSWQGANNPAPAQNVGIRAARGERIVLSSPEVAHSQPNNLLRLAIWPLRPMQALVADVFDPNLARHPELQGWIGGGPRQRYLAFLAVFRREDLLRLGGIEERFVEGWGFDDTEFCHRWLHKQHGEYLFTHESVTAVHQPHERPWGLGNQPPAEIITASQYADDLATQLQNDPAYLVANPGRDWGSASLIVESHWWDEEITDAVA